MRIDANSWQNDAITALNPANPARKNPLILNEFGASIGGPIIKNKLFFFGTYAELQAAGLIHCFELCIHSSAQAGNFTYNGQTVNLYTLAANYNATHPGANLPTTPNCKHNLHLLGCQCSEALGTTHSQRLGRSQSGELELASAQSVHYALLSNRACGL